MSNYAAYLEDYHYIKVIIPKNISYRNLYLVSDKTKIVLKVYHQEVKEESIYLDTSFNGRICLQQDNYVIVDDVKCLLRLGKITRSPRFDQEFYTEEWLGCEFGTNDVKFRLWSPVTKEAYVVIENQKYAMSYIDRGIYELTINYEKDFFTYYYLIRINDEFVKVLDPYCKAYTHNFKESIAINFMALPNMKTGYLNSYHSITDCSIYEISIRDLTSKQNGGTFADAVDTINESYGLGYIKNLGITHLQIMPCFGFGGVDETIKNNNDQKFQYNWGYNPVLNNAISNYLVKGNKITSSIEEYRNFIDTMHLENIGIVMDVVYNHVYDAFLNPLSLLVPGYYFHVDERGFLTSASGCGNDFNSLKRMGRRFIIDSLVYLLKTYHLDGFRFDIMNLLDITTLNLASNTLKKINPNILLYGEGWNMPCSMNDDVCGKMHNFYALKDFSFFNDSFRNALKANFGNTVFGYCIGKEIDKEVLFSALTGFAYNEECVGDPYQSINFIECHDGMTFYDTLKLANPTLSIGQMKDYTRLALGLITFSEGVPFYHLGMEFGRTKKGNDNSYNLSDDVNGVDYELMQEYSEVIDTFKQMLTLRKKYSFFRIKDHENLRKIVKADFSQDIFMIRYYDYDKLEEYLLLLKNDYKKNVKYLSPNSELIFDGRTIVNKKVSSLVLTYPGIFLIKK